MREGFVHENLWEAKPLFVSDHFWPLVQCKSVRPAVPCFTKSMLWGGDPSSWMGDANHVAALVGSSRARIVLEQLIVIFWYILIHAMSRLYKFKMPPCAHKFQRKAVVLMKLWKVKGVSLK
jgi:hypothetical protein